MLHKIFNRYVSTSLHATLLTCISLSAVTPIYSDVPLNYSECAFNTGSNVEALIRVKKSLKKLEEAQKKGSAAVLKVFLSIKNDLETSFNTKFDLNTHMDSVRSHLRQSNLSTKYVDSIQKYLSKKTRSHSRKVALMSAAYEVNDFSYLLPLEAKKHKDKNKNKHVEEDVEEIPASVTYGVTVMLCGCFLYMIPVTRSFGKTLIGVGLTSIAPGICDRVDEKNKEKAKERKKQR